MVCLEGAEAFPGRDAVSRSVRVLAVAFFESAATIFIERGLYSVSYTHLTLPTKA